jgi:hypothetical protein
MRERKKISTQSKYTSFHEKQRDSHRKFTFERVLFQLDEEEDWPS